MYYDVYEKKNNSILNNYYHQLFCVLSNLTVIINFAFTYYGYLKINMHHLLEKMYFY